MKDIINYFRDKYKFWGWMGQRCHDASGINSIVPLNFIVSCDYGTEVPYYFNEEDVFSLEKSKKFRKDWSNEHLKTSLNGNLGREIFSRWKTSGEQVNLLCYRSSGKLEKIAGEKNLKIFAVPENVKEYFDNKVRLYRKLKELSLPRIKGRISRLGKVSYDDLAKELSLPFVVQFPFGSSGLFTFIVQKKEEYENIQNKYPKNIAVLRRYINGFSLNVNAVIVSAEHEPKVFCSFPSLQIVGVPECGNFPSAFCGNDYTSAQMVEKNIIKQVERQIGTIGGWMAKAGYRGIFGMDFLVEDDIVYPVEINPRFQNSTALFTAIQNKTGMSQYALILLHIAEFLQKEDKIAKNYIKCFPERELMRALKGCQLILHNKMRKNVVTGNLVPGVYAAENGSLTFKEKSVFFGSCQNENDMLITCGVPSFETEIEPNAAICKIQTQESFLQTGSSRKITEDAKNIVAGVYKNLRLRDAEKVFSR
ncbi:MAG: ATP-grasp domain-containing protein [Candidatus Omnitrophota bacterium]